MKNTALILFSFFFISTMIACDKLDFDKKDKNTYYYSEDYKTSEAHILGQEVSELSELWSVFFKEEKSEETHYKLVGEKDSKKDVVWEEGVINIDGLDITFIPENGSPSYQATFNQSKDMYSIIFPDQEHRTLTFILKDGE